MQEIFIVGARKIGKGFLGEVYHTAGWRLSFLDKDPEVANAMRDAGKYTVKVHETEKTYDHIVDGYDVYLTDPAYSCRDAFLHADLMALALYPADIDDAAAYLAPLLEARAKENPAQKLTILSCTNKNHIMAHIEGEFLKPLSPAAQDWFRENVALRDVIIRRGTTSPSPAALELETKAVATLLIQYPVYCDLSQVPWMELKDNIEQLKDIKLYTYNSTHACCAFASYLKGYTTINEGMADPEIFDLVQEVLDESCAGLVKEFPITEKELYDFCYVLRTKLKSPHTDYVFRVAFDPMRKLSHNDRLTGNALTCLKHGIDPKALIQSIANGMAYAEPRDPKAMEIQALIRDKGIAAAVSQVCELPQDHELVQRVSALYEKIGR